MRVKIATFAFGLLSLYAQGCAEDFDPTRAMGFRGSLGEEIYKIVCQRMASEAEHEKRALTPQAPYDVSGEPSRALCEGHADPSTAPSPRLRVLAEQRSRLVAALDRMMPEEMESDLSTLLYRMLPFYEPPEELFPNEMRAMADLMTHLMSDPAATDALMRISAREGVRPPDLALGVVKPALAWDGLPEFLDKGLAALDEGGVAADEWLAFLNVLSQEMATMTPDEPGEVTTLDLTRELLFTEDDAFSSGSPLYLTERDGRGLPVPADLTAPFFDSNGDGLADINASGHFIDESGQSWQLPTPYTLADEGAGTVRDEYGRVVTEEGSLLYRYRDIDRSLLAGLLREVKPLFADDTPPVFDFFYGAQPMLGGHVSSSEQFGAHTLSYIGRDTQNGPLFDVFHSVFVMLGEQESDDLLRVLKILIDEHEPLLARLADAGYFAYDNGKTDPYAQLPQTQELWDAMLEVIMVGHLDPGFGRHRGLPSGARGDSTAHAGRL